MHEAKKGCQDSAPKNPDHTVLSWQWFSSPGAGYLLSIVVVPRVDVPRGVPLVQLLRLHRRPALHVLRLHLGGLAGTEGRHSCGHDFGGCALLVHVDRGWRARHAGGDGDNGQSRGPERADFGQDILLCGEECHWEDHWLNSGHASPSLHICGAGPRNFELKRVSGKRNGTDKRKTFAIVGGYLHPGSIWVRLVHAGRNY